MQKSLTEGSTRGGNGAVKTGASRMKPGPPPAPKPAEKSINEVDILKKHVDYLSEQLWVTQEALRRMMMELTNHLSADGADAMMTLMAEWSQIVHNINSEYEKNK